MDNCTDCSPEKYISVSDPTDKTVEIIEDCCEIDIGRFLGNSSILYHVVGPYCEWNDEAWWDDTKRFFDDCRFNLYATCIPETIDDICWYETRNAVPYATTGGTLLGVCP
jgi:hypothetical protein